MKGLWHMQHRHTLVKAALPEPLTIHYRAAPTLIFSSHQKPTSLSNAFMFYYYRMVSSRLLVACQWRAAKPAFMAGQSSHALLGLQAPAEEGIKALQGVRATIEGQTR